MFRLLVGAASIAIVAAVGYFFIQKYQGYAVARAEESAQSECYGLAFAGRTRDWTAEERKRIGECVVDGHITQQKIDELLAGASRPYTFQHYGSDATRPTLN